MPLAQGVLTTCYAHNPATGLASPMARYKRADQPLAAGKLTVTADHKANSYENPITVALTASEPEAFIVYTTSGTVAGDLVASTTYYAIRLSATTISIADSLALALAGTAHNLTGTGSGTHTFTIPLTARSVGERGGNENHSHVAAENAPHTHTATITTTGDQAGAGTTTNRAETGAP